ncbi:MAG: Glycyl-tRNA synthetase beta subunit [Gammaproteobacteria bacterium]|jgi:glycyl-tRNA synthetase beta chain|nr:Glycyl-tRNA synthetase beta subunit [Gammaproteobacteria bacterium]
MADFLVEIHTEELPPKLLQCLASHFSQEIQSGLIKEKLSFTAAQYYATPRRLAVLVKKLSAQQPDIEIERKGPALAAAYDPQGKPTQACLGFARSCGVAPEALLTIKNKQGEWVGLRQSIPGKTVQELLPVLVTQAVAALPCPKRMRWGDNQVEFIRPVHSIILLYGKEIIPAEILGTSSDRKTRGHRFHSKGWTTILSPASYSTTLAKKYVLVDFNERKEKIRQQITQLVSESLGSQAHAMIEEELLDEVTGLVEWPVALCGSFDASFLAVPQEALISAMQDHQRYFPILDEHNQLLPYFITISNIESKNAKQVIIGNERVLRARLSDAAFFFMVDKKQKLANRVESLKNIIFQNKLGTLYDKSKRVAQLAATIAGYLGIDIQAAKHAGSLAKADLTTQLVSEFPELQGTAGYYYALHDGEPEIIAKAIKEHYFPRFSGDVLPTSSLSCALAIADRIDTLVGIFGIQEAPTGDKDPFGLRRAALGVLRIIIERKINLDIRELLQAAIQNYSIKLQNADTMKQVLQFIFDRLKPWYQEQGIATDVFSAVAALRITAPYDFHCRIQAVQAFQKLPEAQALSAANKRVSHILDKYTQEITAKIVDVALFEQEAEKILAEKLQELDRTIPLLAQSENYPSVLIQLATLREPVDIFFDKVMVMTDDKKCRENRLLLLKNLRRLFLYVADVALLQ